MESLGGERIGLDRKCGVFVSIQGCWCAVEEVGRMAEKNEILDTSCDRWIVRELKIIVETEEYCYIRVVLSRL